MNIFPLARSCAYASSKRGTDFSGLLRPGRLNDIRGRYRPLGLWNAFLATPTAWKTPTTLYRTARHGNDSCHGPRPWERKCQRAAMEEKKKSNVPSAIAAALQHLQSSAEDAPTLALGGLSLTMSATTASYIEVNEQKLSRGCRSAAGECGIEHTPASARRPITHCEIDFPTRGDICNNIHLR